MTLIELRAWVYTREQLEQALKEIAEGRDA